MFVKYLKAAITAAALIFGSCQAAHAVSIDLGAHGFASGDAFPNEYDGYVGHCQVAGPLCVE